MRHKEVLLGSPQTNLHVIKVTRKINSIQGAICVCTQLLTIQQTTLLTPWYVLCSVSHCTSSEALSFTTAATNLPLASFVIPVQVLLVNTRLFKLQQSTNIFQGSMCLQTRTFSLVLYSRPRMPAGARGGAVC